jgi:hypothetical protein
MEGPPLFRAVVRCMLSRGKKFLLDLSSILKGDGILRLLRRVVSWRMSKGFSLENCRRFILVKDATFAIIRI